MTDLEFFQSRYSYDPLTGIISSKILTWGHGCIVPVGAPVGYASGNRVRISVANYRGQPKQFKAHRVAWLLMIGEWPAMGIDHIDGDGTNNRWSNLRLATQSQNLMNRKMQDNNTSGFKGVTRHGTYWRAQIWVKGKRIGLGNHRTKELAYEAYCKANREIHGEFGSLS
jgi:hypothetical protein